MNLKYYLRGLGIGIVVTAVIMSVAGGKKESLSNAEIKERAKALGMVEEGTTLAENLSLKEEEPKTEETEIPEKAKNQAEDERKEEEPVPTKEPAEEKASEETKVPEKTEKPEATREPEETQEPEAEREPEETEKTEKTEAAKAPKETSAPKTSEETNASEEIKTPAENETITLEVKSGASSYSVCRQLEEAGLIASAGSFDSFLCQNGYDKRIKAGSFEIPSDADPEQIARIISGME